MANYSYIKLKKDQAPFTAEKINEILNYLNENVFYNSVVINWDSNSNWTLEIPNTIEHSYREFCISNPRKFSMRHGGGGDFIWWVDSIICQEIKNEFNGKWIDDGVSEPITDMVDKNFFKHQKRLWNFSKISYLSSKLLNKYCVPKQYFNSLKKN